MKSAILTIGNELLAGFTVDTNSSWLSQNLNQHCIKTIKKSSASDNAKDISLELNSLFQIDVKFLFITGGLGPTSDDITRNTIKQYFNLEEEFDNEYFELLKSKFRERGIKMPSSIKSQAITFKNCEMLDNPKGTAKGLYIFHKDVKVFVLPGVPSEMRAIFEDQIVDKLPPKKEVPYLTLRSFGISESSLEQKIYSIIENWNGKVNFAFLPSYKGIDLRLNDINSSSKNLNKVKDEILQVVGKYFYGESNDTLESVVLAKLVKKNITLSTAESCTGGRLSFYITANSGSSKIFKGGIIAYSNEIKENLLGINKNVIVKNGSVSQDVALQMAKAVKDKFDSDIGIGITGISGPSGGTKKKPVGLVYISINGLGISKVKKYILKLDRKMHQEVASYIALNMIRKSYFV